MSIDKLFVSFVLISIIILLFIDTGYEKSNKRSDVLYEKASVVNVDDSDLIHISVSVTGEQKLRLLILSGRFEGDTLNAINTLLGQKKLDKIFKPHDKVLSVISLDAQAEVLEVRADDYYRQDLEIFLLFAFVVALVVFAGFTGFKAALSFVFTALVFWKILIPAL